MRAKKEKRKKNVFIYEREYRSGICDADAQTQDLKLISLKLPPLCCLLGHIFYIDSQQDGSPGWCACFAIEATQLQAWHSYTVGK